MRIKFFEKFLKKYKISLEYGPVAAFFSFWQGRCTFFACLFTVVGIWGFIHHYDLTSFALFATAIQGLLVAHSIKEDYTSIKRQSQSTQVVNNITVDPATAQTTTANNDMPPSR
jgi:hypothetical protein